MATKNLGNGQAAAIPADAKNALANRAQNPNPTAPAKRTVKDLIMVDYKDMISASLPKLGFTPERFTQVIYTEIRKNPQLGECSPASIIGAVLQSAQLGLMPGSLQHCYLIPYKKNKKVNGQWVSELNAEFQIGYKGYLELLHRTGQVAKIDARPVHEKDQYHCSYGSGGKLTHVEYDGDGDPGKVTKYYAYVLMKDGSEWYHDIPVWKILQHRDRFAPKKPDGTNTGPWATDFDSMALKTVIKALVKLMPLSADIQQKVAADETLPDLQVDNGELNIVSTYTYEESDGEVFTGEAIPETEPAA